MMITTNRILPGTGLFAVLCCVLLYSPVNAQPDTGYVLDVHPGDSIQYLTRTMREVRSQVKSMNQERELLSLEVMRVDSLVGDSIFWTVITTMVEDEGEDEESLPHVSAPPEIRYRITDRSGELVREWEEGGGQPEQINVLKSMGTLPLQRGLEWFLTREQSSRQPGAEWKEVWSDTVEPEVEGFSDMHLVVGATLESAYDGIVDTLGTRMLRFRRWATDLDNTMSAEMKGVEISVRGSGDVYSVSYYLMETGQLVLQTSSMEMEQHSSFGPQKAMSVLVRQNMERRLLE